MSWQDVLSDEDFEYVRKGREWLDSISEKFIIYDKTFTNKSFYHHIMTCLSEWGTFEEADNGNRTVYTPNDPNQFVQVIIDHISLCNPIDGHSLKIEIDLISSYCVSLREKCKISIIMLQQENRNSADVNRVKANMTECSPDGLQDSSGPYHDCEVCIGIYYPLKFKVKTHLKYPIIADENTFGNTFKGLRDRYRCACLIKNRYGQSDRLIPLNFFGEIGIFREMPKADEVSDWTPYIHLETEPKTTSKDENEDEVHTEPKKEIIYNF